MWPLLAFGNHTFDACDMCEQRRKEATNLSVCFVERFLFFVCVKWRDRKVSMEGLAAKLESDRGLAALNSSADTRHHTTVPFRKEHTHCGANDDTAHETRYRTCAHNGRSEEDAVVCVHGQCCVEIS